MKKLWLTYAWTDNENRDVDFIVQELKAIGLDVRIDRAQLIPGQRLWQQIGDHIERNENSDAWGIVVSERSLKSEACQEELAIALDRALRSRGDKYPLIGIFLEKIDPALVPPAIRIRLHVSVTDGAWAQRVKDGVELRAPGSLGETIAPHVVTIHKRPPGIMVELRPRTGRWLPTVVAVPVAEKELLKMAMPGPKDAPDSAGTGMVSMGEGISPDGVWYFRRINDEVTPDRSLYVFLSTRPSRLLAGPMEAPLELKI